MVEDSPVQMTLAGDVSEEMRNKFGRFEKGNCGYWKGKKRDNKTKENMSRGMKGRIPWNKGKSGVYPEEVRKKMSEGHIGKVPWMKGRKHSVESKRKNSESKKLVRWRQVLPVKDTLIERKIQDLLTILHIPYRKHFPVYYPRMGYHQVDIMLTDEHGDPKVAIECDGCYWHGCPLHCPNQTKSQVRDRVIDECLGLLGIEVMRFWECEILSGNVDLGDICG